MTELISQSIVRWERGRAKDEIDELVEEEPLEIRVRGQAVSITMRTGGHDAELAAGFLFTEGIVRSHADVLRIEPCDRNEFGNVVNVLLAPLVAVDFARLTRHVFASSSCGLCGKASIEAIHSQFDPIPEESTPNISASMITALPTAMRKGQAAFDRTGGLHAAALFDETGNLLVLREDIGRHNAVDKVVGYALLNNLIPLNHHVLLVSGRSSFEIMQKSLAARIPIVAAVSAPSSLAVQFAKKNRQTLIGFLREGRFNVYAGVDRVRFE
jgi:FdhD protein